MIRKRKGTNLSPKNIEVIEAVGGHQDYILQSFLDKRRFISTSEPDYDTFFYRMMKGGTDQKSKYIICEHPHGFEILETGQMRFWCLPYHPIYRINKVVGIIPENLLSGGGGPVSPSRIADNVEAFVQNCALEAIADACRAPDTAHDNITLQVFEELQSRR
jgi:hypothetical protein